MLEEGTILRAAHSGMLASLRRSAIYVYQRPRVAILSTGDELLEIDEPWQDGKIINSNSYSIAGQVLECGGQPLQLGIARDRREELSAKMKEGLVADILITTGGVSVGDYDLVKGPLEGNGPDELLESGHAARTAFGLRRSGREAALRPSREIRSPA